MTCSACDEGFCALCPRCGDPVPGVYAKDGQYGLDVCATCCAALGWEPMKPTTLALLKEIR